MAGLREKAKEHNRDQQEPAIQRHPAEFEHRNQRHKSAAYNRRIYKARKGINLGVVTTYHP